MMHIQICDLDLGCLCPKSHDLLIFSLCRRDEMFSPGIIMVEDYGYLVSFEQLIMCTLSSLMV